MEDRKPGKIDGGAKNRRVEVKMKKDAMQWCLFE